MYVILEKEKVYKEVHIRELRYIKKHKEWKESKERVHILRCCP